MGRLGRPGLSVLAMPKTPRHFTIKHRMMLSRRVKGERYVRCDLCDRPSRDLHKHEIVNDGRMPLKGGEATARARFLADAEDLSALLCPACHSKAHNAAVQQELLRRNVRRLAQRMDRKRAYERIKGQLAAIDDLLAGSLRIPMPALETIWTSRNFDNGCSDNGPPTRNEPLRVTNGLEDSCTHTLSGSLE